MILNGIVQGAQTFLSVVSNGDTIWAVATNGTAWQEGNATYASGANSLTFIVDSDFRSSNANALVNFSSGTVDVSCDLISLRAKVLERLLWAAAAITPPANDGTALGTGALAFSDLFLADGGVLNFNNGNYTVTHSSGRLSFSAAMTLGGALTYGGVALSNAVTGTGNMVLSASPTITGTAVLASSTHSGTVTLSSGSPNFILNKSAVAGNQNIFFGNSGGLNRWALLFGDTTTESGSNAGSNFSLLSYDDSGAFIGVAMTIFRNNGGVNIGGPTGGNKGSGTLNAQAVYDDNVLLTCMALEFLNDGKIDTDYWDSTVPDRVIPAEIVPARVEQMPVMEDVEVTETVLDPVDGGYIAREETKTVSQQVTVFAPVHDVDGNGIDAIEEPVFETKEIPEQILREETIEPRRHELAHTFKAMVDDGFDPRSPVAYIAKLKKDQALPGMPTKEEWEHGSHSVGEIHNRLWLATELLAMTVVGLETRIAQLETHRLASFSLPLL